MIVKSGDFVWVAYLQWGRSPIVAKSVVIKAGPKSFTVKGHGNWGQDHPDVVATEREANQRMLKLLEAKHTDALGEVEAWRKRIDAVNERIAAL